MRTYGWAVAVVALAFAGCSLNRKSLPVVEPISGMELVAVPGGCFQMGNVFDAAGPEEKPAHEVCVGDFYLGRYEVTQGQWKKVMGSNPSVDPKCGDDCPVTNVSWNDAQQFLGKLGPKYRLPTEAEWEYAARSGGQKERFAGRGDDDIDVVGWYQGNAEGPQRVGQKQPNGLGLYDMTGNVWELTADWYGGAYYATSPRKDPTGPASGERRALRGGSYAGDQIDARTSYRNHIPPDYRGADKGFRVLRIK